MDLWVMSTFWLLGIVLLWEFMYKYLSICFPFFGGLYLSGIAGPCNGSGFNFWRNCHPVSKAAESFSIPTSNVLACHFLCIPGNTYYFLFLKTIATLVGMKWYCIVVLICISLMIKIVGHLVLVGHLYIFFREIVLCQFLYWVVFLLLSYKGFLYNLSIRFISDLQVFFSHSIGYLFTFFFSWKPVFSLFYG